MSGNLEDAEEILGTYKRMMAECQQIAAKISEVSILLSVLHNITALTFHFLTS